MHNGVLHNEFTCISKEFTLSVQLLLKTFRGWDKDIWVFSDINVIETEKKFSSRFTSISFLSLTTHKVWMTNPFSLSKKTSLRGRHVGTITIIVYSPEVGQKTITYSFYRFSYHQGRLYFQPIHPPEPNALALHQRLRDRKCR